MQRAREIEPLSCSVNLYLGVAQTHAGQYDLAIRQMQQSIELEPGYYRPHMFLGRTLMAIGRHEEAISELRKALELSPDNLESLAYLGSALAANGDHQGALDMVDKVKAAESRTEPAVLIASIYAKLGLVEEMYKWLDRAIAMKSTPIYIAVLDGEMHAYRSDARFHRFLASIGLSHLAIN